MPLNFNVDPYYDDFDETKNFHRILFKPGRAVQARELTQAQSILQNQITKFADHVFKQNSPVSGGQVTTNFNCYYIKLQSTFAGTTVDVNEFNNLLVTNAAGTIRARVIAVAEATGTEGEGDPPTLIVSYKSGTRFTDGDIIYDVNSNKACQALTSGSTGLSSVASISQGVFYVLGNFAQVSPSTLIIDKYNNNPTRRIGLEITETIYDYANDSSLLDPAVGASNFQAPGADRYVISLTLSSRPTYFGDDEFFIELVRVENGNVFKMVDGSVYATIDDYFAKRDYEANGDYIINDFTLTPKADVNVDKYIMGVGKGLAYVSGYRVENPSPIEIVSNRARTTGTQNNEPVFMDYVSYFLVSNVRGQGASTFDITTSNTVDFHCVTDSNINTANSTTYNSTLVASGYIRSLEFDTSPTNNQSNTYIYKAFVFDLQNKTVSANVVSATSTTVTLPGTNGLTSTVNDAYVGVTVTIIKGTNAGESRLITAYNGSTRVATVGSAWSVTPDTSSVFSLSFETGDIESMVSANKSSYPATLLGSAKIDNTGKTNNLESGRTILENPSVPEMIFRIGNPYVSSISSPSYTTYQQIRNISFGAAGGTLSATIPFTGSYAGVIKHLGADGTTLSSDVIEECYTIIVTNKGTNTTINVGDILVWTTGSRTVSLNGDGSVATFQTTTTDLTAFTATIIAKVFVTNGSDTNHILKIKNLVTANSNTVVTTGTNVNTYTYVDDSVTSSGQIYIENGGIVSPGSTQSLYLSDVKRLVKVIDTKTITVPTLSMLTDPTHDITRNFVFDNGQRDNYYDHASITLRPGAPKPTGHLLVLVDYYKHAGGDGYFSKMSYIDNSNSPEDYREIPTYISKNGAEYLLRDCLDFRPARLNAQSNFIFRYSNPGDTSRVGSFYPADLTTFVCDYSFFLGRRDKLILSKDKKIEIVEGAPGLNPNNPNIPDNSLVLADLIHNPYTGYVPTETPSGTLPDLSVNKLQHRRYTMADIAGLDSRINNIEYYTSLSLLEQNANSLQISDAYGLNRFKNGILVDDFSGLSATETGSPDFNANINRRTRQLSASQNVSNYPLKSYALAYNMGAASSSSISSLNFAAHKDGFVNHFTLPYTTSEIASQRLASRTVNINPFAVTTSKGVVSLSPNVDNWVDTKYQPSLLIIDPDLQIWQSGSNLNVMQAGDWQSISGVTTLTNTSQSGWQQTGIAGGRGAALITEQSTITRTFTTVTNQTQKNIVGAYNKINNTYSIDSGFVKDISILPFIRKQEIAIRATDLLFKTEVNAYFDDVNVNSYLRKTNEIELTGVSGTFNENDIIGYFSSGNFTATGVIVGVYRYANDSTKARLYVAGDARTTTYDNGLGLKNAVFNTSGVYQSSPASGNISSVKHVAGSIRVVNTTTSLNLSSMASSTNDYYTGNTIYINTGTGIGQSAVISQYNGTTKIANLATPITCATGDLYSIGNFASNEQGSFYGIFIMPENTFQTGQRTFRLDNRINNNLGSITTYAEGVFYADGLQVTKQNLNFGASPAGAKDTFVQTNQRQVTTTTNTTEVLSRSFWIPWDPVAQTFIIDPANYPNGAFLSSIRVFFASKPDTEDTPVTLSIVGTLNGYPNGTTLDNSIVTLQPQQVKVTTTPQYLDTNAYTEFNFSVPVYIQPGVLYAFILRSSSNEYTLWTASNGDTALASSVKNLPTDPLPSSISKITTAPYVGGLFISQNAQTWNADQNQSLMFVMNRCKFTTSVTPSIRMVVPKKLPQRTLISEIVDYYKNANTMTNILETTSNENLLVGAFNVSTSDFIPSAASISYTVDTTLQNGTSGGQVSVNPGKFGTSMFEHIYLNDNKGERVLQANSDTSFSLYAQLSSTNDAVSPVISDAATTVSAIQYNINNCELSNSLITLVSGGSGYNANTTSVTVSAPTGKNGQQAYAAANISGGVIRSVYLTSNGSGYIETPTITITDANTAPGSGASVTVAGETSAKGGPAINRYLTRKVVLDAGFDSGDLIVYISAYRPVNTDILVYYKILNRNDTQPFDSGYWQLMTKINNCDTLYSQARDNLHEYTFAPGTNGREQGYVSYTSSGGQVYTNFSQFALKIVMVTTDKTIIPYLNNMRCIALPSNVNLSL
jgi:hypothetical protein